MASPDSSSSEAEGERYRILLAVAEDADDCGGSFDGSRSAVECECCLEFDFCLQICYVDDLTILLREWCNIHEKLIAFSVKF